MNNNNDKTSSTSSSSTAPSVLLSETIPVPPVQQRFDHLSVDLASNRLFVAATGNSSIYVVDLKTNSYVNAITGLDQPQGVFFISQLNELVAGNEGNGVVSILNGSSPFQMIKSIKIGSVADNIQYNPATNILYVSYGNDTISGLAVINARTNTEIANIALNDGHPEAFELDTNDSRIFMDDPGANSIDVIDIQNNTLLTKWSMLDAFYPETMALDQSDHRLFVGFMEPPVLVVFDTQTGKPVANITISSNVDDTFYDPIHKLVFASCGGGYSYVIQQKNVDSYQVLETLHTGFFARTSLYVPQLSEWFIAGPQNSNMSSRIYVYAVS